MHPFFGAPHIYLVVELARHIAIRQDIECNQPFVFHRFDWCPNLQKPSRRMPATENPPFCMTPPSDPKLSEPRPNLILIDILRGTAALAVVLFHAGIVTFFPQSVTPFFEGDAAAYLANLGWLNGLVFMAFGFGYLGVPLFFVISGFCIHLPYAKVGSYEARGGARDFFKRRFWRIYPPYLAVICFAFFLAGPVLQQHARYYVSLPHFFDHLWFWYYSPKAPTDIGIVGVAWTVALEVHFYILYALVGRKLILTFGAARVAWIWFFCHAAYALLLASPIANDWQIHGFLTSPRFPITRFGEWLLGAWVADWWIHRKERDANSSRWIILGAGMFVMILLLGIFTNLSGHIASDLLSPIGFAFLLRGLLGVTLDPKWKLWRIFTALGAISYSLYLVHIPVLAAVKLVMLPKPGGSFGYNMGWLVLATVSSLIVAAVLYRVIEKPSHDLGRSGHTRLGYRRFSWNLGFGGSTALILALILFTGWTSSLFNGKVLSFTGPPDQSFFQVADSGRANIPLEGFSGVLVDQVEWCSARLDSVDAGDTSEWKNLSPPNRLSGFFRGTIELGPGQHIVWLRSRFRGGSWMSQSKEIFIGDLYLVMGDATAAGQSETPSASPEGARLLTGLESGSRSLHDPQNLEGLGSHWPECGKLLTRARGYPVGFINLAQKGGSVSELSSRFWLDKSLKNALRGGRRIKAVLWSQGEADSATGREEYNLKLRSIIDYTVEGDFFSGSPCWIISTTSWNGNLEADPLRRAQQSIVQDLPEAWPGPDTDSIRGSGREGQGLSFSKSGNINLAELWADSILSATEASPKR